MRLLLGALGAFIAIVAVIGAIMWSNQALAIDPISSATAIAASVSAVAAAALWFESRATRRDHARQAAANQTAMRANILVENGSMSAVGTNDELGYIIRVIMKNVGALPAHNVTANVPPPLLASSDTHPFDEIPDAELDTSIVGPNGNIEIRRQGSWTYEQISSLRQGKIAVFLWGEVRYQDHFGARRFVFRLRIKGLPSSGDSIWALSPHPIGYTVEDVK